MVGSEQAGEEADECRGDAERAGAGFRRGGAERLPVAQRGEPGWALFSLAARRASDASSWGLAVQPLNWSSCQEGTGASSSSGRFPPGCW
jgi:hypothetical protein